MLEIVISTPRVVCNVSKLWISLLVDKFTGIAINPSIINSVVPPKGACVLSHMETLIHEDVIKERQPMETLTNEDVIKKRQTPAFSILSDEDARRD